MHLWDYLRQAWLILAAALPDISATVFSVLGVLMSFPEKASAWEDKAWIRRSVQVACFVCAAAGLYVGTRDRLDAEAEMKHLAEQTDKDVSNTTTMVSNFSLLMPKLNGFQSQLDELRNKEDAAKGNPELVALYKSQIAAVEGEKERVSRQLTFSTVTPVLDSLRAWANRWRDEDNDIARARYAAERNLGPNPSALELERVDKPFELRRSELTNVMNRDAGSTMLNADTLRQQLLPLVKVDQADQAAGRLFAKLESGQQMSWKDIVDMDGYMYGLALRAKQARPPTD